MQQGTGSDACDCQRRVGTSEVKDSLPDRGTSQVALPVDDRYTRAGNTLDHDPKAVYRTPTGGMLGTPADDFRPATAARRFAKSENRGAYAAITLIPVSRQNAHAAVPSATP